MKYTKDYLNPIILDSTYMWDVVEKCGIKKQQGNYNYIARRIRFLKLDTSHFEDQRKGNRKKIPVEEYFNENKFLTISGNKFKEKLFKANLKKEECEICSQGPIWRGIKISLILDHIDGNRGNNLLNNLQIVCPNCNATLPTHCGKNKTNKGI